MTVADTKKRSIDLAGLSVEEIIRIAEGRGKALEMVLTRLGDFAFPDRDVNGGDLVDTCNSIFDELTSMGDLEIDVLPKVVRLDDGTYRMSNMDITDDLDEAGAFFGSQPLDPNESLVDLPAAIQEVERPRLRC